MSREADAKKYALITVCMASFLTPFMASSVNLAIPSIGKEFNSSALLLSWVVSSYLLATAAFLVPFGRFADIAGRKKIFIWGLVIFSLSSLLCGLSWSVKALILFRLLQGVGGAMIFSTAMAILTSVYPPQERGRVLGINIATVYTGLSLGPVLGGAMNHYLGWQSIFYLCVLLCAATVIIAAKKIKGEWAGAGGELFDTTGAFLYTVGLVLFMYGFSSIATSGLAKLYLGIGLALIIIFVWHELRVEQPILNIRLFSRNAAFAFSNLAALINYSATFAVTFLLSIFLQVIMGFDSQISGLILLSQPAIMAVLSPFAGTLSDRVEPRIVASWGMALTTLGLILFGFLSTNTPIWLVVANLALLGTGFALFSSPNSNAIMGSVDKRFYGVASSTMGTMRMIGQAVSMATATLIIDLYVGNAQLSTSNAGLIVKSVNTSFVVFAITCFGGIFASLSRGKIIAGTQNET